MTKANARTMKSTMKRRDIGAGSDVDTDADVSVRSAGDVTSASVLLSAFAPIWPTPACVKSLVTTRRGGVSLAPYDGGCSDGGGEADGEADDAGVANQDAHSGNGGLNLGFHTGDLAESVAHNRARVADYVGQRPIAWVEQCHGVDVAVAGEVIRDAAHGQPTVADAVISDKTDEVCAIMVADCLPVLFADTQSRAVGAAHAGWRGLCGGVLERTAQALRAVLATKDDVVLLAYLGPSIGPTAFEVGDEVRAAFMQAALPGELAATSAAFVAAPITVPEPGEVLPENAAGMTRKYFGDLPALARLRLARVGVESVSGGDFCTFSDKHRFYSYRRDGRTGRFAALIWRQGKP